MLPTCLPQIRKALSDLRLNAYRRHPSEDELDLLARYAWNMALGAALYTPLHLLEVALRNALHTALAGYHGGNERWYLLPHAFPLKSPRVKFGEADKVQEAMRKLVSRGLNLAGPDAPGRVVAELDFGFWTSLLTRRYGQPAAHARGWRPLWPALTLVVFPHFPNPTRTRRDREKLAERFDNIRELRNRISHHEPIWRGRPAVSGRSAATITDQYAEILEALGWLSPDVLRVEQALGTFPKVHSQGEGPYRALLQTLP
jgi:hypothetical protein